MKKNITTLLLSILAVSTTIAQTVNSEKSIVNFKIGNMKINTVEGTFSGMNGEASFNVNSPVSSAFNVCIDATTVNTNNKKRDEHLRTSDFFDTQKFSTICFKSSSISKSNGNFLVKGDLTMHGITKEVEIPFTFSNNVFMGTLSLKRLDYKIGEDTSEFMVGNDVEIEITCIINQK